LKILLPSFYFFKGIFGYTKSVMGEVAQTTLVVFGITGDLSHRYLLPALAEIKKAGQLPKDLKILGISRREISPSDALRKNLDSLGGITDVMTMNLDDLADYRALKQTIGQRHAVFYLAVPPDGVLPIIQKLGKAGLNGPNAKLLLEKPFGIDLDSAKKLISQTEKYFEEQQVYRIDHYLAKEMVQNIAIFLGSNVLFRDVWNSRFVDYIEIVAAEKIGVGGRGGFYEQTGALRDIIQSHLLQLAALTMMDPCPHDFDFADLPARRLAALRQLKVAKDLESSLMRGQYRGYRREVGNAESASETFVALKLQSADERWQGVQVYLASGKNLDQKLTQIRINFKKVRDAEANTLILRVQPREGIELDLWVKQPGYERRLQKKSLSFYYEQNFEDRLPDAYEQVIVDVLRGSHTLFASGEEVLESWRILQPVLDFWSKGDGALKIYKPGSSVEQVLKNS
jgi:glucose-6-phosphate 1-dehydrogenase